MARSSTRRTTLADFEATGRQDCANVFSISDFAAEAVTGRPGRTAQQVVDAVWASWEADPGYRAHWVAQNEDAFDGLDATKAYAAWRAGWKERAVDYVEAWMMKNRENPARRRNPAAIPDHFVVVRVGRDDRDRHAVRHRGDLDAAIAEAIELANADPNDLVHYATVRARDAGAARLVQPARWTRLNVEQRRNPAGDDGHEDDVLEGVARAIWLTTYADYVMELPRAQQRELGPGQGGNWNDVAPETPPTAMDAARQLVELIEEANEQQIPTLLQQAAAADRKRSISTRYAAQFGHYLAMQALGTGTSWFDDHGAFPLKVPHFQATTYDGESVEWSPRNMRNPSRRR
jgi:hypothetical protein